MELQNAVRKLNIDRQSRAMLPEKHVLSDLRPGRFVRLQATTGAFFWARVMRVYGRKLVLIADDSLPSGHLKRGDELETSIGAVFMVV
jgi:hypothetical protein